MDGTSGTDRARRAALAALLVGAVLTFVAAGWVDDQARRDTGERFDESALQVQAAVETELRADLDKLRDVGAFVQAVPSASPAEVSAFVQRSGVFEQFRSLVGVVVLERVDRSDLDAFVARQRARDPGFTVTQVAPPPPGVPAYVITDSDLGSVDFTLPRGLDVAAVDSVRQELDARGAKGEAAAGAIQHDPVIRDLAQRFAGTSIERLFSAFDFVVAVPVWAPGTSADRGDPPVAWVAALAGGFEAALQQAGPGLPAALGMDLAVDIENPALASDAVKQLTERRDPPGRPEEAALTRTLRFETDGIRWTLRVWSGPEADVDRTPTAVVLVLGLVAAGVAAAWAFARARSAEREQAFTVLAAAHQRAQVQQEVLASVSEAVVVLDADGRIVTANPGWERLRGRPPLAPSAASPDLHRPYLEALDEVLAPTGRAMAVAQALDGVRSGRRSRAEVDVQLVTDGRPWWSGVRITPFATEPGALVVVHRDVTDRKRSEAHLHQRATRDPLTGLLNRAALEERATRVDGWAAVLFIDLDDFKAVNDRYGHAAGDAVLQAVGERIRAATRATDLVARLGGDEFVVVLATPLATDTVEQLADRLALRLTDPVQAGDQRIPVSASIGVVRPGRDVEASLAALLDRADGAMYRSKQAGGATYTVAD